MAKKLAKPTKPTISLRPARPYVKNGQGQKKFIKTPEEMWKHFEDFLKKELSNPWLRTEYVGKDGRAVQTKLQTPIMMEAFYEYCAANGISKGVNAYVENFEGRYNDFKEVVARMRNFCFVQNFKGAAVGAFAHSFIARRLGMVDKHEVQNTNIEVKMDLGKNKPKLTGE